MTKQYKVTLNLSFKAHAYDDFNDYGYESESDSESSLPAPAAPPAPLTEKQHRRIAFERTDRFYETHSIEEHVMSNDPCSFVECLYFDGETISAEWDDKNFAIHIIIETDQNEDEIRESFESISLEDGEYEGCGDFGWIVMTRGPNNEIYDGNWDKMKDYWEYGLTDFRQNPILVEEIKMTS